MAFTTNSTLAPSRASTSHNFPRRLALLAAALAPAAALAVPETTPAQSGGTDGGLLKAASEVQAALAEIGRCNAAAHDGEDGFCAALDDALDAYRAAVARLAEAGCPETPAGLAALAAATLSCLRYEVVLFPRRSFEEQADNHEMLAARLAEAVLAGRHGDALKAD